jgi:LmbE family N-acetylglucosaminyl deacetylase
MLMKRLSCTALFLFLFSIPCLGKANPELTQYHNGNTFIGNRFMNIVAHQDDDLLFMNPDLMARIQKGCEIETVYLTAGDNHKPSQYWLAREAGSRAAYAYMAQKPNEWQEEDLEVTGKKLVSFILRPNPKIRLIFLRLPDGIDARDGEVTLRTIWQYDQVLVYSKDQKNLYRKYELVKVLRDIMEYFRPDVIEYVYPGDHVDHFYTARFAGLTEQDYSIKHTVIKYRDYNITTSPFNLDEFDSCLKWNIVQHYGKYDQNFPKYGFERMFWRYYGWCHRQYYYESKAHEESNGQFNFNVLLPNLTGVNPARQKSHFCFKSTMAPKENRLRINRSKVRFCK